MGPHQPSSPLVEFDDRQGQHSYLTPFITLCFHSQIMSRKICTSLLLSSFSLVAAVGPDITARDRLVKDLPNGVFAGKKLTPKVMNKNTKNNPMILFQSDERTVIDMHLSAKSIDLDFKSGVLAVTPWEL